MPDLDTLLAPVGADTPCGPPLDYDPAFMALEQLADGVPERQYGDTIIPAEEPDYDRVLREALALLERSRDIRLATLATRALTRTRGLDGCALGLELVSGLVERYWQDLHPALSEDGVPDPVPRANAFAALATSPGLLQDIRSLRISSRYLGQTTLGEIERALAGRDDARLSRTECAGVLEEAGGSAGPSLERARTVVAALQETLRAHLGVEDAPDLQPLLGLLSTLAQAAPAAASAATQGEGPADAAVDGAAPAAATPAGTIRSREDAIAMLDQVCRFLEQVEPANPAPLLIRRARGLIGQDFLSVLRDIAPEGVAQFEHIAGLNR